MAEVLILILLVHEIKSIEEKIGGGEAAKGKERPEESRKRWAGGGKVETEDDKQLRRRKMWRKRRRGGGGGAAMILRGNYGGEGGGGGGQEKIEMRREMREVEGSVTSQIFATSREEAANFVRQALRRKVMVSSTRQAVSGFLAAGGATAARYVARKMSKAWKSRTS